MGSPCAEKGSFCATIGSMSVSVCPIAIINAPVNKVWSFLSEPANYALWWNAETRLIVPEGHATPGQKIYAQTSELGRKWDVNLVVDKIDEAKHQIDLTTMLPFGITVHNHITCIGVDHATCQVSFG